VVEDRPEERDHARADDGPGDRDRDGVQLGISRVHDELERGAQRCQQDDQQPYEPGEPGLEQHLQVHVVDAARHEAVVRPDQVGREDAVLVHADTEEHPLVEAAEDRSVQLGAVGGAAFDVGVARLEALVPLEHR